MDRLLLIHESSLKPLDKFFDVKGIDMCAQNLLNHDSELLDKVAEKIKFRLIDNLGLEDATKYGNKNAKQQENSYSTVMKYEIADCVDDLLDDLAELKAEVEE